MRIENNEMIADAGKAIKRKADKIYFVRCTLLKEEDKIDFDEIDLAEAKRLNKEIEDSEFKDIGEMS